MEVAVLTSKYKIPVRLKGISPQVNGASYEIIPTSYNVRGELLTFSYNGIDYIYVDQIDYEEKDRKHKGFRIGYCKVSVITNYKKIANQIENLVKPENWFDDFEFAKKEDLFKIDKVEFLGSLTEGYKKYFKYSKYEFKITNENIDFSNIKEYPPINLDANSPNYCKITRFDYDQEFSWSTKDEGNFFTKNFKNKIDAITASVEAKEALYEGIIKICFRIDKIYKEILDIIAIEKLQDILSFIKNIPANVDAHEYIDQTTIPITTVYFTKTDKTIAHLLLDWGYKDLNSTKNLPYEVNEDQFYDGLYKPFNNYYNALCNFYNNLVYKDEVTFFDAPAGLPGTWNIAQLTEQDNKRFNYLSIILPSSAISLLNVTERLNLIKTYIDQVSISTEAEFNILRIIHSFYLFPEDGEKFLNFLLIKKDGIHTNFELLFNLFDDHDIQQISPVVGFFANGRKNRRNFIFGLYEIWRKSKFDFRYIPPNVTPTPDGTNPNAYFQTSQGEEYYKPDGDEKNYVTFEFGTIDLPPQYPGDSPGLGLSQHIENNYYIDEKLDGEKIHITKVITNNFYTVNQDGAYVGDYLGNPESWPSQKEHMYLHIYQPLNMVGYKDYEDLKDVLPKDPILPAFVYYYCEEYDRIKDINAAWSLAIDVSAEIVFFFISGGVSVIKDLKYLKYAVKIGKALRATSATQETVLILRGTEAGFEIFTITTSICFFAAEYIANTSDSEAAKKLANLFFWLTMLGAGATLYARTKATKAAEEITANPNLYNAIPDEVKPLIDHLVGAEQAAIAAIKATMQQKYPNLYSRFVQLLTVEYQKIFMQEFSKANPSLFKQLDDFPDAVDNWKSLFDMAIKDRKNIEIITDQAKYGIIKEYYSEPLLRDILEPLDYSKRWIVLTDANIITGANSLTLFNAFKNDTDILEGWIRYHLDSDLTMAFKSMATPNDVSKMITLSKRYGKVSNYGFKMIKTSSLGASGKIMTAEEKMKRLLDFPEATHNIDYFNNRRAEMLPSDFEDSATGGVYRLHETDSFIQLEIVYGGKCRPSVANEAGDIVMQGTSTLTGKSLDPLGITHKHSQLIQEKGQAFFDKWLGEYVPNEKSKGFLGSIHSHFEKIYLPKDGKNILDRVVIDYKYFDEVSIVLGQSPNYLRHQIDQFVETNFHQYNNNNYLIKLNY